MGRRRYVTAAEAAEAAEGEEFLRRYLAGAEPRLQWLRELSARTGGPAPDRLDYSRDSLLPLWTWAMGRFRQRPEDEPTEFVNNGPRGRYYLPRGPLPMWYGRRAVTAPHKWDNETLQLIDALVYYLAESILRAVPTAQWEVFHADVSNHIDENQPVLTGFPVQVDPLGVLLSLAGRTYHARYPDAPNPYKVPPATPTELQELYDAIVHNAKPA
ncbi:MAG: hypothetical protein AUI14_18960 [Actinobacteria bacterium 13_2_20CM_2_71_6]|nr:MAG: hypothetical protein AUI14_18960 [Actinobacteria bacterium 13_2_20CM_2_71_6]